MPPISSLITITGLLDCYPTVPEYSLSTIQHECWREGGTWHGGHHQGFDEGFDRYQGFTDGFPETSDIDWNSLEQFEDFRLFIKGMESWYTLQGIPDKDGDTTRLEYLLNFLGPIGRRKHEQWNPSGVATEEREKNKKSAKLFMEFLHSSMDHPVSQ